MGDLNTGFPSYQEGIAFVKRVDHPQVRLMAALNYFLAINESFDDIKESPELCLHAHIVGDKGLNPVNWCPLNLEPRGARKMGFFAANIP